MITQKYTQLLIDYTFLNNNISLIIYLHYSNFFLTTELNYVNNANLCFWIGKFVFKRCIIILSFTVFILYPSINKRTERSS